MKLNNKGITLIEIIVSIVLISIVIIFLSILLIDVKDINDENNNKSSYLANKALITKTIEEDIMKYDSVNFLSCYVGDDDLFMNYHPMMYNACLKMKFDSDVTSYLMIFRMLDSVHDSYVITYVNETNNIRKIYEINEYEDYNLIFNEVDSTYRLKNDSLKMNIEIGDNIFYYDALYTYSSSGSTAVMINIPVLGDSGKDYTIRIPYYGEVLIK